MTFHFSPAYLVFANFENHVDVFLVLKEVVEAHNVTVSQSTVDANLTRQLRDEINKSCEKNDRPTNDESPKNMFFGNNSKWERETDTRKVSITLKSAF